MASGRPLLSLVMIMRDAAAEIEACLASCAGAVDEMIICDTGSADASVKLARRFLKGWLAEPGARRRGKLISYAWRDDFAAARNFALEQAKGQWALLLDSDERLAEGTKNALRTLAAELAAGHLPTGCTWDTALGEGAGAPDLVELWRHNVDLAGREVPGEADDLSVRIARIDRRLRYRGQVHEQLIWTDGRPLGAAFASRELLFLLHTGYRPEVKGEKDERNYRLLRRQAGQGGSTYLLDYYLAQMYFAKGEYGEAARQAEAALISTRPVHDRFAPWRLLYQSLANLAAAASGEERASLEGRVDKVLEAGLKELPDWPDFYYFRGGRRWNAGREAEGLADLEQARRLAEEFAARHPDQEFGFAELLPMLEQALGQARREIGG